MPRTLLVLALVCAALGMPLVAHADGDPDPSAVEAARADFADGSSQYRAKKYGEALKSFERSYQAVQSPNVLLMMARCQRELNRPTEAASTFASAEYEAKKRVKNGETKYDETAKAAAAEGNVVRKDLGEIRIHVVRANGASVYVDRKPITLTGEGDGRVWHEPGSAQVLVIDAAGNEQKPQTATVTAGAVTELVLTVADAPAPPSSTPVGPPPKPPPRDEDTTSMPGWFWPATIAAGGTTLVAGGLAIGFGLSSQATYKDLYNQCGPNKCSGTALRDAADSGQRSQTIANVGWIVGAVGLVATAVIVYFGLKGGGIISGPL